MQAPVRAADPAAGAASSAAVASRKVRARIDSIGNPRFRAKFRLPLPSRRMKVSAIVPVYNPGSDIDDCIRSLLDQSLRGDEYEVIFVDDGSTDETPARLDELAAQHENVRVEHIPNSGWPGKPRNV